MNAELFPNFFIIGAAKCGTTAVYEMLRQHQAVYMPLQKEPNFFCNQGNFTNGVDWYTEKYFKNAGGHNFRGEASTHYLYWSEVASKRMSQIYGSEGPKLIAIFRDPVKRAYSHYWMMVRRRSEDLSFENALKAEKERLNNNYSQLQAVGSQQYGYFRGGMFASLVKPFLDTYPRENLHCILLDDLISDFNGVMNGVIEFLGINDGYKFRFKESNSAFVPRSNRLDRYLRHPSGVIFQVLKFILTKTSQDFQIRFRQKIVGINKKPSSNPPMEKEICSILRNSYSTEIDQLEKILNQNLNHWKVSCE